MCKMPNLCIPMVESKYILSTLLHVSQISTGGSPHPQVSRYGLDSVEGDSTSMIIIQFDENKKLQDENRYNYKINILLEINRNLASFGQICKCVSSFISFTKISTS